MTGDPLVLVAVLGAVGAAVSGAHPTGYHVIDALYAAGFGFVFCLVATRADRATILGCTAVGMALSRGWLLIPALIALGLAFYSAFLRERRPVLGGLIGALEIQVILRWPNVAFHGFPSIAAAVLTIALIVSSWPRIPAEVRRRTTKWVLGGFVIAIVISAPAVLTALSAKSSADRGANEAKAALDDVGTGSTETAVADLRSAASAFSAAHSRTDAWWTWGGALVPFVAQQHHALVGLSGAGHRLAAGAASEAGAIDFHNLTLPHGGINLSAVSALVQPLRQLELQIDAANRVARQVKSRWLVPQIAAPLNRLSGDLARAQHSTQLANEAVEQVPGIFGADGIRHYLIVFMTPAETRGLGGFFGAYAEVEVDGGKLKVTRTGLPKNLTDPNGTPRLTGLADYLARYGSFEPQDHLEDVDYSPDFPTVADVLMQLYPQVGGTKLDGVLDLDPNALAALLNFTGPISVAGFPDQLTSANAADILLRQQYVDLSDSAQASRHDLLQQALSVGFQRLSSSSLPAPKSLGSTLGPDVRQGRLMFWTAADSAHPLLTELGLDGAFPELAPGSGYLTAVTIANAANNKIDAYLHEEIGETIHYDPADGAMQSQVTVSFRNDATTNLPQYVIGSFVGSGLPLGTDYIWLSLYSSVPLTGATFDGRALRFERGVEEFGEIAYSTYVQIPAGGTGTVVASFDGRMRAGTTLQATLRLQPLAYNTPVAYTVVPGGDYSLEPLSPATWSPGTDEIQTHTWKFRK